MGMNGAARIRAGLLLAGGAVALTACAGLNFRDDPADINLSETQRRQLESTPRGADRRQTVWDLFGNNDNPDTRIEVNKYIWVAAQDVLDFLPITAADPFSGVFTTGYGTPPGGRQAYRATVYVQDPALDARSLNVALLTASGPASADTVRAIEDAILTRARQLRLRDARL
ncbi:DUF3576 domain-containing protein [Profundibacterium mesophilum]|uniref:DUF3576 domain-containing protein n=1 Tax=Profundibacterium mesophilum KAUST100406-0324 TaxID=1037889 RepID=A0A921TDS5_9RHOB|nr:DUF3576 domain-containing protein [Profundibacterium mesophilum]KAF0676527.1 hypothetical protein PMES_01259 [Profundibacterium mesophilum KAUST100406-0324]